MAMLELKPERYDAGDFNDHPLSVCGKTFHACVSGALYWPAERAMIVSDLHLEKGSSFARRGQLLPPYDTKATLLRLAEAIDRWQPETVIALGDSLHDGSGAERMAGEDLDTLRMLQDDREWIWVTGNHDPVISSRLGGHAIKAVTVEGITFRHEPRSGRMTHEVGGHYHPAAKVSMHGHTFRRPCFVANGLRLVMPAFGTYCGGLNVLDDAFAPLFGHDGLSVWIMGQEGLYPIAARLLRED